jgi:hypothetical protein
MFGRAKFWLAVTLRLIPCLFDRAKFWLAVLGVMHWDALNPVPPEMW